MSVIVLNKLVFDLIWSKLIGEAEISVGNRIKLDAWKQVKPALKQCFSDRRDLDYLDQKLTRVIPLKIEYFVDLGTRLQCLKNQVAQRISNDVEQQDWKVMYIHLWLYKNIKK